MGKVREEKTHYFCYLGYGSETGREFGGINEIIGGRVQFVSLREMSAHAEFVRDTIGLGLDVYDKGRWLEGAFHNVFHFFATKGAMHSAGDNFFVQVCADFVGIIRTRRMVRENYGARERGEFAHWEAVTEIACEERIRTCQVMFVQEEFEGIGVIRGLDMRKNYFVVAEARGRWSAKYQVLKEVEVRGNGMRGGGNVVGGGVGMVNVR
jgi:hypothetical protein